MSVTHGACLLVSVDTGFRVYHGVLQLKGKIKWEETVIIMQVGVKLRTFWPGKYPDY